MGDGNDLFNVAQEAEGTVQGATNYAQINGSALDNNTLALVADATRWPAAIRTMRRKT